MDKFITGTKFWDGKEGLPFIYDDGGRADAGYKGSAGDCVTRAVTIAAAMPYEEVYQRLASGMGTQRKSKGRSARNGISTSRKWFKDFMAATGFVWTPCMKIGEGCKVHLLKGELPESGSIIAVVSRHYTAIIDGVIHDTHDPTRETIWTVDGVTTMSHRCVYGYWTRTE